MRANKVRQKCASWSIEHTSDNSTIQKWIKARVDKLLVRFSVSERLKYSWTQPLQFQLQRSVGEEGFRCSSMIWQALRLKRSDTWLVDKKDYYLVESLLLRAEHTSLLKCSETKCVTADNHITNIRAFTLSWSGLPPKSRESLQSSQ